MVLNSSGRDAQSGAEYSHDDKERLAKVGGAALAAAVAVRDLVAGIVLDGVGARKADQRLLVGKAAQITDLGHELRTHGFADAGHSHDGIVIREMGGRRSISVR